MVLTIPCLHFCFGGVFYFRRRTWSAKGDPSFRFSSQTSASPGDDSGCRRAFEDFLIPSILSLTRNRRSPPPRVRMICLMGMRFFSARVADRDSREVSDVKGFFFRRLTVFCPPRQPGPLFVPTHRFLLPLNSFLLCALPPRLFVLFLRALIHASVFHNVFFF